MLSKLGLVTPLNGWWMYLSFLIIAFLITYFQSEFYTGTTSDKSASLWKMILGYLLWAIFQQGLTILTFVFLFKSSVYAIICCSLIFSVLHYPNTLLIYAVGFMQSILLLAFYLFPNFYPLPIIHCTLALTLYLNYPTEFTKEFRVLNSFFDRYIKK